MSQLKISNFFSSSTGFCFISLQYFHVSQTSYFIFHFFFSSPSDDSDDFKISCNTLNSRTLPSNFSKVLPASFYCSRIFSKFLRYQISLNDSGIFFKYLQDLLFSVSRNFKYLRPKSMIFYRVLL
jgi:hypothetical protein